MIGPGAYSFAISPQQGRESQEAGLGYVALSGCDSHAKCLQLGIRFCHDHVLQKDTTACRSGVGGSDVPVRQLRLARQVRTRARTSAWKGSGA